MILLELVNNSKEYWDLKLQLDQLAIDIAQVKMPAWQKFIISIVPLLAIISAFLIGWFVPTRTFRKTREFELEKRNADIAKSKEDDIRKLYAKIVGISSSISHTLSSMNFNYIYADFFHKLIGLTNEKSQIEHYVAENKRFDELVSKAIEDMKGYMQDYSTCVAEYHYYHSDSMVYGMLAEMFKVNQITAFTVNFTDNMGHDELVKIKDQMLDEANIYLANTYAKSLTSLSNMILLETKS